MNEVKRSLDVMTGDLSSDKEEVKQRVLAGKRKPKRRNPMPFVATAIVLAAVLFLAFNLLDGDLSENKRSHYVVDETLFDLILMNEEKEYQGHEGIRFSVLQQILYTDSLMEFAKSAGYEEDLPAIKEQVAEQQKTFYDDFTEEERESLDEQQLENFGYSYDEYFEHILTYTARYTAASKWLEEHPPEQMITHREALDQFMKENDQEITAFKEKKHINTLAQQNEYVTFDVFVTSVEGDTVAGVSSIVAEEEQIKSMAPDELEDIVTRFKVGESASQIKPSTFIRITYDSLSYPISQADTQKVFGDVENWEAIEGPDGLH